MTSGRKGRLRHSPETKEFRGLHPYIADDGTRLFEDVPAGYRLDLVSSTPVVQTGILELQYRRHR